MSENSSTSVHTKSSSQQKILRPTYRETLLQDCHPEIDRATEAYEYLDNENQTYKTNRLLSCRTGAIFYRNRATGAVRVGAYSCHLRFCPICSRTRKIIIQKNVAEWLKVASHPKFMTFTLKHNDDPLVDQLDRLYNCFQLIRRRALFKNRCSGGIWFFQITKSKTDKRWHPHIHCVCAGGYIPQRQLSKIWKKITGDSTIVDIRLIRSKEHAAKYVSRYATKPAYLPSLDWVDSLELLTTLEQRRICGTWGECRKLRLTTQRDFEKSDWYSIGSWNAVFECKDVDEKANKIIRAWRTGVPLTTGVNMDHLFMDADALSAKNRDGPDSLDNQTYFEWKDAK